MTTRRRGVRAIGFVAPSAVDAVKGAIRSMNGNQVWSVVMAILSELPRS
jgi:hypothetical protein